jgi:hypothetical protein
MLNRVTLLFIIALLIPAVILPQSKTVLRSDGKIETVKSVNEVLPVRSNTQITMQKVGPVLRTTPNSPQNVIDTLRYEQLPGAANFGFFGQEWMIQWFEAPTDLFLHKVGIAFLAAGANTGQVEVKVVKGAWTLQQFQAAGVRHWGYYESSTNPNGAALKDNPDATGNWVPKQSLTDEPWGEDLWSEDGSGWETTPIIDGAAPTLTWIDLAQIMSPDIKKGEIFGIAVKNLVPVVDNADANRLGLWSYPNAGTIHAGFNGWKYYALGRLVTEGDNRDYGWWSREYVWDMAAEVEFYGDLGPTINSFTALQSGVNVGPFTIDADIVDTNPGNPAQVGVASAVLQYTLDSNTVNSVWTDVAMTGSMPNFQGQIPAQAVNHWVYYRIVATDVNNNSTTSGARSFFIFAPAGGTTRTLVIFNGFASIAGYPQSYYFGNAGYQPALFWADGVAQAFRRDRWAYGAIPNAEMLNGYDNIFEIWSGEGDYNDEVIRQWLAGSPTRNYYLAGQEYLGAQYGYENQEFAAGDFEYDILGVTASYNDISYTGAPSQTLPTELTAQPGTQFGGPITELLNSYSPVPDSLLYHPQYELGEANWQDAFDVISGQEVDITVKLKGIDGDPVAEETIKPTHTNRVLPAGNKIVFLSYDPISLNTASSSSLAHYHWVGYSEKNSPWQALLWFDVALDVREVGGVPTKFELTQNYPNPFNPATIINFSIPELSKVTLKVYDVLGKEVATLLNEEKAAGNYEVKFDASKLTSGVYFYSISTGSNVITKKMMLLK